MTDNSETTMTLADYAKAFHAELKWLPETEEAFEYGLGCLPPLAWNGLGFLVGEAYSFRNCTVSGNGRQTYSAHAVIQIEGENPRYYLASLPLTVAEWKAMTREAIMSKAWKPQTTVAAMETSIYWQEYVARNSPNPAQRQRCLAIVESLKKELVAMLLTQEVQS